MTKYSTLRNKFEFLNTVKPNTTNAENFPAWKQPLERMYMQLLTAEMFGHTFYAKEEDRLRVGVKVIEDYVNKNPDKAAKIAEEARNKYYMRTFPILASVYLSTKLNTADFTDLLCDVVKTPRDAIQFVDLARSGVVRKGMGRKVKTAFGKIIADWMEQKGEFYATKYKNQINVLTKLTHPKINSAILDYIMDNPNADVELPTIDALEAIKTGDLTEAQVLENIKKYRLDWNSVKGITKPTKEMWRLFLNNMSMIALIKNVNTACRHLEPDEVLEILRNRLSVENLKKGRVLPIRLMQAYSMVDVPDIKRFLGMLANDYSRAYDFSNLGKTAICPDVSASMNDMANKRFSYAEMAGMFAGVIAKGTDCRLIPWDTRSYPFDEESKNTWKDVVYLYDYCKNAHGGGTNMDSPVNYLISNKIKVDTFVLLTDTVEWAGTGWIYIWQNYLQKINRDAKAILIRSDSYIRTQPYPPELEEKYNIYQFYGYSDQAFKLITQI